jgi:hypothetical protein
MNDCAYWTLEERNTKSEATAAFWGIGVCIIELTGWNGIPRSQQFQ